MARARPFRALLSPVARGACLLSLACLFVAHDAGAIGDPELVWETFTTAHFEVHAHQGLRPIARRVVDVAENIYRILSPELGWQPKERTHIVLTDDSDFANGSATALPYDTVRLFVTAPEDLSPLNDYDDWLVELVTHEYTHILHTDHITGLPAIYNAIVGKTYSPNQAQPRWLLEGLAVLEETRFTSGGRNRSSIFDMYLRADVLNDYIAPIDQVTHTPRRWPQGNLWYLYGSHFLEYISNIYGHDALRAVAADYSNEVIPFGINRAIHRVTGKTYIELYDGWIAWMKKRYAAQKVAVEGRGLREGTRLTFTGQEVSHPRYAPRGAGGDGHPRISTTDGVRRVVFYRNDAHTTAGLYAIDVSPGAPGRVVTTGPRLVTRTAGPSSPAFLPDGGLVYNSVEVSKKIYFFWDLFRRARDDWGRTAVQGERLTVGMRASEPAVSPDGTQVVFTVDKASTRYLYVADLDLRDGRPIGTPRKLVDSARYDQVYTPRWSPDGTRVAFSAWTAGGFRDVKIVDVATGVVADVTHDRAVDTGPAFSADGRRLFFSSDRTGISNVYAFDLAQRTLKQVTNVTTGAFMPEPSRDGKYLAYIGYSQLGYDLWEMPLDEAAWLDAEPSVDRRGPGPPAAPAIAVQPTPYDPWPTLRPYTWSLAFRPDAFGQAAIVTTGGGDVVGHHAFSLQVASSFEKGEPGVDFVYIYRRFRFDTRMHLYRYITPRGGYRFADQTPTWIENVVGTDVSIAVPFSTAFWSQSVAFSYAWSYFKPLGGLPVPGYDPYTRVPVFPETGHLGTIHVGWGWSNAERYLWSVGPAKGFSFSLGIDVARQELAGDYNVYDVNYSAVGYFPMPWLRHHVLALHTAGGATGGDFGRRSGFALGGFADIPLPDALRNLLYQPSVALRGYKPGARFGDAFQLMNAEYRFPIVNVDRGVQTLPLFFERVYGNFFVDYGDATSARIDLRKMKLGIGAELFIEFMMGYFIPVTLRIGVARGTSEGGETQTYLVLSQLF